MHLWLGRPLKSHLIVKEVFFRSTLVDVRTRPLARVRVATSVTLVLRCDHDRLASSRAPRGPCTVCPKARGSPANVAVDGTTSSSPSSQEGLMDLSSSRRSILPRGRSGPASAAERPTGPAVTSQGWLVGKQPGVGPRVLSQHARGLKKIKDPTRRKCHSAGGLGAIEPGKPIPECQKFLSCQLN